MQPEQQFPPDVPLSIVRPTSVTVLAILAIIHGSLTLIMLPFNIAQLQSPGYFADPNVHRVYLVGTVSGTLVAPIWIVSGIGLLRLCPWARRTFLVLCLLAIVYQIIYAIASWNALQYGRTFDLVTLIVFTLLLLAYFLTPLILITRPKVTAAFRRSTS